jgi:hypothetical protein
MALAYAVVIFGRHSRPAALMEKEKGPKVRSELATHFDMGPDSEDFGDIAVPQSV